MNALTRALRILSLIPSYPRSVSTVALQQTLAESYGMQVHLRTLQRDLLVLATVVPLQWDDTDKPYLWYFQAPACRPAWLPVPRAAA